MPPASLPQHYSLMLTRGASAMVLATTLQVMALLTLLLNAQAAQSRQQLRSQQGHEGALEVCAEGKEPVCSSLAADAPYLNAYGGT